MRWSAVYTFVVALVGFAVVGPDRATAACTLPNTLVNGSIADATQVMANFNSLITCIGAAVAPTVPPQGRLTLTSGAPVMTTDATNQMTIYYTPYVGNLTPIGGSMYSSSELPYLLSNTAHLSGNLYDVFAYLASGAVALCTGPAWTNTTTRSAAINITNGIWSNTSSLTCTLSGGGSTATVSAGNATYLGTFYATGNGQTGMQPGPDGALGGASNILGVYNGYNRVLICAASYDLVATYTYGSATWRPEDNSAANAINYVDGLGQSAAISTAMEFGSGCCFNIGSVRDSTTAQPVITLQANGAGPISVDNTFQPATGFHSIQAMEASSAGSVTFYGVITVAPARQLNGLTTCLEMRLPFAFAFFPAAGRRRRQTRRDR